MEVYTQTKGKKLWHWQLLQTILVPYQSTY